MSPTAQNPAALYQQAITLYQQGRFTAVAEICRQLLQQYPQRPQLLFLLGSAELGQGRYAEAQLHIEQAIRLDPNQYEYHYQLGIIHHHGEDMARAIDAFRRADSLKPGDPNILANLALTLKQCGELAEAETRYRQLLDINPRQTNIIFALSKLHTFTHSDDKLLHHMQTLVQTPGLKCSEQGYLHFALAKAMADLQDYDASFRHLEQGNALERSTLNFDIEHIRQQFARIKTTFAAGFFAATQQTDSEDNTPIFIVGMPRSGSTLIEQILASHPLVHGADEHNYFKNAAYSNPAILNENSFPEAVPGLNHDELQQIAVRYLAALRHHSPRHAHITDKMLGNTIFIGLIKQVLPRARVIHCLRHPLDTCFSCYRHFFGSGQVPYSYDLHELGHYYLLYRDLMRHWQETLGDFILDVYYEDIITDHVAQTRKLLDFCKLPWDDACIDFHKTERTVKTSSLSQVRQPINRAGLNTWQPYRHHLQPLIDLLEQETATYPVSAI